MPLPTYTRQYSYNINIAQKNDKKKTFCLLTNNIKMNEKTSNWLCRDLALIHSCVTFLCPFYLQCPIVRIPVEGGLKSLI